MFSKLLYQSDSPKESKNEKKHYSAKEKFIAGCQAIAGQSVIKISQRIGMSREYIYQQKEKIAKYASSLNVAAASGKTVELTRNFIERSIIGMMLYCHASEYGVQQYLENVYGISVSIGYISGAVNEAAKRAQKYDDSISLEMIHQGANDEIFQGSTPVLTGIDPESTYVYLLEEAADRKAETWEIYMNDRKNQGLNLDVSINDGGTGLLSGITKAFPEMKVQLDVFHADYEMGKEVRKLERKAYAAIRQHEYNQKKPDKVPLGKRMEAALEAHNIVKIYDTIFILYGWLKEMLSFSGYSIEEVTKLVHFILDEMVKCAANYPGIVKEAENIRKNLPSLLLFVKRLEEKMNGAAAEKGIPPDAFRIMYRQLSYSMECAQYQQMEYELVMMLMEKYDETESCFQKILNETKKASSLVENVNGRIRTYMNIKRIVPTKFFVLMKVFFNTKPYKRSRRTERVGKSPLELLTGKPQPSFFEALGY